MGVFFCVDPNWLSVKVVAQQGRSDRLVICLVSHHSWLLLSAMEVTISCACVCKVGYFDVQIRHNLLYNRGRGF